MTSLKEYAQQTAALAVSVSHDYHMGQSDPLVRQAVEEACDLMLRAKSKLARAHRHLNGDEPISGVA